MFDQSSGANGAVPVDQTDATSDVAVDHLSSSSSSSHVPTPHADALHAGMQLEPRPSREEQEAIVRRVNEQADRAAFYLVAARDHVWIRGLIVAAREQPAQVLDVLTSDVAVARLTRIAAILERAERDARLTPMDRLSRALSSVVVEEILHQQREASRG